MNRTLPRRFLWNRCAHIFQTGEESLWNKLKLLVYGWAQTWPKIFCSWGSAAPVASFTKSRDIELQFSQVILAPGAGEKTHVLFPCGYNSPIIAIPIIIKVLPLFWHPLSAAWGSHCILPNSQNSPWKLKYNGKWKYGFSHAVLPQMVSQNMPNEYMSSNPYCICFLSSESCWLLWDLFPWEYSEDVYLMQLIMPTILSS